MTNNEHPLPKPSYSATAKQCREMGINVGDTIIGRESYAGGWNDAMLTLIFVGEFVAVFKVMRRNSNRTKWRDEGESAGWRLNCREWYLINGKSGNDQIYMERQ